jgi:NADH dehydrogenase
MNPEGARKHVIIVGGGFAGLACARALGHSEAVRVTLIDKNNYHQFQPLFYQLATSQLAPADVGFSLRKVFRGYPNVDVKLGDVAVVDPKSRSVATTQGETYRGDFLVLAGGSQANFFDVPGADRHTFPLYSLVDAERLRSRILELFEDADRDPKLINEGALNFVIVGGGTTGTEMAGGLAEMIHRTMMVEYSDLAVRVARIVLVDRGPSLLAQFSERAHQYAAKILQRDGVELRLGSSVKEVHPGHVVLSDGATIKTRCVIWAGGLMAAPFACSAGLPQGGGGRIEVQPDLTVEDLPGVYALGDFANIPSPDGTAFPQLAAVALQAGRWAAKNILAELAGNARTAFHYHDKGIMAMLGKNAAIAEVGEHRHELHGAVAYAAWLGVHLALMTDLQVKIEAFVDWTWDYFSTGRGPQLLDRSTRINWGDDDADGKATGTT